MAARAAGRATSKTFRERWIIKEVFPLYAALGLGLGACAFHLTRMVVSSPDVHLDKKGRSSGMPDEERALKAGTAYYDHGVRRALRGRHIGIFPKGSREYEEAKAEIKAEVEAEKSH